jgi:hypothetical protein
MAQYQAIFWNGVNARLLVKLTHHSVLAKFTFDCRSRFVARVRQGGLPRFDNSQNLTMSVWLVVRLTYLDQGFRVGDKFCEPTDPQSLCGVLLWLARRGSHTYCASLLPRQEHNQIAASAGSILSVSPLLELLDLDFTLRKFRSTGCRIIRTAAAS